MVKTPHLDSLLCLIPNEVQEALVFVSNQSVIILVRVCHFVEYVRKILCLGLIKTMHLISMMVVRICL